MDRDANYVAVGAFVLLLVGMAASFVFWYTGQQDKRTYQRYEIYFQGSVSGLTEGSPVRYLGVDVGKVVTVQLAPRQRKIVEVIADVDSTAPIDGRTLASLTQQGITGLLYVDLQQDKQAKSTPPLAQGERYPVIRTIPSDFDMLLASLPALTTHAVELIERVDRVFSDDNIRAIDALLANSRDAAQRLPSMVKETQNLILEARAASQEIELTAADLHRVTQKTAPDIEAALENARRATDKLASTADHLDRLLADNEGGVKRFTGRTLPEFESLLRDTRSAVHDFRDLSRSLKEEPSRVLYRPNDVGVEVAK